MLRVLRTFLALVILVPSLALAADAPLKVIVFPGGFNWPIWVAQDKAFFKDNGVTIHPAKLPATVPMADLLIRPSDGVTVRAMSGESVTLSGADIIDGWKREADGTWSAALPSKPKKILCDG